MDLHALWPDEPAGDEKRFFTPRAALRTDASHTERTAQR
jgi:hypothetical protein